jgi:hypothetical protein
MCRESIEIQRLWHPINGDHYFFYVSTHPNCIPPKEPPLSWGHYNIWYDGAQVSQKDERFIWLPRQDQLQRIYGANNEIELCYEFFYFIELCGREQNKWYNYTDQFNSMEQLWIVFVMYNKFNKIWNGKGWVKIDE